MPLATAKWLAPSRRLQKVFDCRKYSTASKEIAQCSEPHNVRNQHLELGSCRAGSKSLQSTDCATDCVQDCRHIAMFLVFMNASCTQTLVRFLNTDEERSIRSTVRCGRPNITPTLAQVQDWLRLRAQQRGRHSSHGGAPPACADKFPAREPAPREPDTRKQARTAGGHMLRRRPLETQRGVQCAAQTNVVEVR